jgi:hypothetical protein
MEEFKMSDRGSFIIKCRVLVTLLLTMAWLVLVFGWMVSAWSQYNFFQILIGLGIATLLYAAITGTLWVVELGVNPAATILATFGWLSFLLYWIGFAWSRYTWLQNGAILTLSLLAFVSAVTAMWLARPADQYC